MARTLSQILSEVDTAYAPQRASIQEQQKQLVPQEQAQEAGLNATKDQSFNDILSGARQRGLGFSGIPLGEQAKYVATTYLPAVANLKQSFNDKGTSLTDALNSLTTQENQYAQTLRQSELDREQQQAQFEQSLAQQRASAAAAAASPTFGGAGGNSTPQTDPLQQLAYNDVYSRIQKQTPAQIKSDYLATLKSANYGNLKDKYKIQLYNQFGYKYGLPTNPVSVNNQPNTQSISVRPAAPQSLSIAGLR